MPRFRRVFVLTSFLLLACGRAQQASSSGDTSGPLPDLENTARGVLMALRARDGIRLASYVHPVKGLRVSPYAYVNVDSGDVVLTRAEVADLFRDSTVRTWGRQDGSGDPLRWPFERYYKTFIYDVDFAAAPVVRSDQPPARGGNSPSNLREAYPQARWVEYHFPGVDPKFDGMDWRSLWVVLERGDDRWLLVGLVHGSWTI